jgi:hypothetical protein
MWSCEMDLYKKKYCKINVVCEYVDKIYDSKSLGIFKVEYNLLIKVSVPLYYLFHTGNKLDELSHSLCPTWFPADILAVYKRKPL